MIGFVFTPILKLLHIILGVNTAQNFPPPLEAGEEAATFRLARAGSEDARQKLILHNLRLRWQRVVDVVGILVDTLLEVVETLAIGSHHREAVRYRDTCNWCSVIVCEITPHATLLVSTTRKEDKRHQHHNNSRYTIKSTHIDSVFCSI